MSSHRKRMRRSTAVVVVAAAFGFVAGAALPAVAYWTASDGTGDAHAVADRLPAGSTPSATVSGDSVAVTFARATTTSGRSVSDYLVRRYPEGATSPSVTFPCAWPTGGALTCSETGVPHGTWYYTTTPVMANWKGAESAKSAGVLTDSVPPTVAVSSITPAPNGNGWNTSSPVVVTLSATDDPGGSGVSSLTYRVDTGPDVTVTSATVAVSVTGQGTHSVSFFASDHADNVGSTTSQTIRIDSAAPGVPSITSYPATVNAGNQRNLTVTGAAEPAAAVALTISDSGSAHTVTPATVTASDSGTFSFTGLDLSTLTDGGVTYRVTATDAAGNVSTVGSATGTKDATVPTVTVNQAAGQPDPTKTSPIHFTVVFGESVVGLTSSSVVVAGTAGGTKTATVTSVGANTCDVAVQGMTTDGTVSLSLPAGAVFDLAGNPSGASTSTDNTVAYDTTGPPQPSTVLLANGGGSGNATSTRRTRPQ